MTAKMKIAMNRGTAAAPIERHPVEVMQESFSLTAVERGGQLVPAFSFATADGRGTSPEVVPLDELPQYVEVLLNAVANGIPERAEEDEGYVPSYVLLDAELRQGSHRTIVKDAAGEPVKVKGKVQYEDHGDRIFFRSRIGRGAKTQKIRPDHFADVVAFVQAIASEEQIANAYAMFDAALPGLLDARAKAKAEAEGTVAAKTE